MNEPQRPLQANEAHCFMCKRTMRIVEWNVHRPYGQCVKYKPRNRAPRGRR